jgi:thioredoxin reductase (NADPH)
MDRVEQANSTSGNTLFDCIVIGAGPGGLQASIHLGRYNFKIVLFHTPGGRTGYAKHIENYLGIPVTSGPQLLETGLNQVKRFGVLIENAKVERVTPKGDHFEVAAGGRIFRSRFVIAASGARETLAPFKNLHRFFGLSYFTCMICDGYRTTGKKLLVIDRTVNGVRLSVGMKQMYTKDVTFLAHGFTLAPVYRTLLRGGTVSSYLVDLSGNDHPGLCRDADRTGAGIS